MKIKIADARRLAKENDQQAIVILGIEKDGTITIVTYGEDKKKCQAIGEWADSLEQHGLLLIPFNTVFGWGNGGKPTTGETLGAYLKKNRRGKKSVSKCRVCGCTDTRACEGGCSWAEEDLCSSCAL
jgi:hypothetical protein